MRRGIARSRGRPLYVRETRTDKWETQMDDPLSEFYARDQTEYGHVGPINPSDDLIHQELESPPQDKEGPYGKAVSYGRARHGLPPDPTIGGEVGTFDRLGWTKGIQNWRWIRQPFHGGMLGMSGSKAHPADGPVGRTNWYGMLAQNVNYQFVDLTPTPMDVAAAFTFANAATVESWEEG